MKKNVQIRQINLQITTHARNIWHLLIKNGRKIYINFIQIVNGNKGS